MMQYIDVYKGFKVTLAIFVTFSKNKINTTVNFDDEEPMDIEMGSNTSYIVLLKAKRVETIGEIREIERIYNSLVHQKLEALEMQGSGWSIKSGVKTSTSFFRTPKNKKGSKFIQLEAKYHNPLSGLINLKNDDNLCAKWCLLFHQSKKSQHDARITVLKKITDKYNWFGISFPMGVNEWDLFEINNADTVVNILDIDGQFFRKSRAKGHDIIHLVLFQTETEAHYIYVKNISYFLKSSKSHPKKVCERCLQSFTELK